MVGLRVTSKWFVHTLDNQLDQCLEWVESAYEQFESEEVKTTRQQLETYFFVLAHEVRPSFGTNITRDYQALTWDELQITFKKAKKALNQTHSSYELHAHEVIWGPCKLYFDVDIDLIDNPNCQCEDYIRQLLFSSAEVLKRDYGLSVQFMQMDSSKPEKFSRHIVGTMTRTNDATNPHVPQAFANAKHCEHVVRSIMEHGNLLNVLKNDVGQSKPLCDMAVYRSRGCMRTVYSSKLTEPERLILPYGNNLSSTNFELCMVSGPFPDSVEFIPVVLPPTPVIFPQAIKRSLQNTIVQLTVSGEMLASSVPEISMAGVQSVSSEHANTVLVRCYSRDCARKGAAHRSNRVYYVIDINRRQYRQDCYSPHCNGPKMWKPLPQEAQQYIITYNEEELNTSDERSLSPRIESPPKMQRLSPGETNFLLTGSAI